MLKPSPNPNHQVWWIKHQRKLRRPRTVKKKEAYQKSPCWRSCRAGTRERSRPWLLSKSFTLSRPHLVGIRTAVKETRETKQFHLHWVAARHYSCRPPLSALCSSYCGAQSDTGTCLTFWIWKYVQLFIFQSFRIWTNRELDNKAVGLHWVFCFVNYLCPSSTSEKFTSPSK